MMKNIDNNVDAQKWFPPAGVSRATARVVKKPYFEVGSVLLNKWQNDTTARVNPIMKLKQYGYVIYGQYTNLEAIDMYTHSALESLNVRLISNVVKKKIFDVCLNLAFEPNTENLWNKFFAQMDEFLRYMKYNEGVYDYRIVMEENPYGSGYYFYRKDLITVKEFNQEEQKLIFENFGVNITSLKLRDVTTFLALAGASQLNNLYIKY